MLAIYSFYLKLLKNLNVSINKSDNSRYMGDLHNFRYLRDLDIFSDILGTLLIFLGIWKTLILVPGIWGGDFDGNSRYLGDLDNSRQTMRP